MEIRRKKITIVGAGNTGATTAHWCVAKELGDVVLFDVVEGMPQGKALDLAEAGPVERFDLNLVGTNDWAETAGSDVVVITAGIARKPGMSRKDLLGVNFGIVKDVTRKALQHSPDAFLVVLTNPLDIMAYVVLKASGLPRNRVVGQAGILDGTRFRTFIAEAAGVSVRDVQTMVMGGHADMMVPLVRYTQIGGIPLDRWLDAETIERLVDRTRKGGGEIVQLLKTGSAYFAPGAALTEMIAAILRDQKRVLSCSAYLEGEYGLHGLFAGVPVVLGGGGIERIVELDLLPEERQALERSAEDVRQQLAELPETL